VEEVQLADSLSMLHEMLPNDPATQAVLMGHGRAEAARRLIAGTRLADPAVRQQLYQGGEAAIEASTDSMIVLMRTIDPEARRFIGVDLFGFVTRGAFDGLWITFIGWFMLEAARATRPVTSEN
jgi:hypothetical protein